MGVGATPQYCYEFWRAQGYERIVRAPLLANNDLHAVCGRHWQVAGSGPGSDPDGGVGVVEVRQAKLGMDY